MDSFTGIRNFPPSHKYYAKEFQDVVINNYSLNKVFYQFGIPSEIYLNVQGAGEVNSGTLLEIVMVFEEKNMLIHYYYYDVMSYKSPGIYNEYKICPINSQLEYIQISINSPDSKYSLIEIGHIESKMETLTLKPIDEVTDVSIEDFYNLFNFFENQNEEICFYSK